MIEGTVSLKCSRCNHCEVCQWVDLKMNGCDWFEEEPKTGHWKRISMDKYVQHAMAYYRCSECGEDIIGEHRYCPNCGAKMQEVE